MNLLAILVFSLLLFLAGPSGVATDRTGFRHPPADSFPPLPPAPVVKRGWAGTFTYTVRLSGGGNRPRPYSLFASFNRLHRGYLELTREIKSPIRVNQPDKDNARRWESWIPVGRKTSWNFLNDSLSAVTVITSDPCCRTPHDHIRTAKAGSPREWQTGELHNYNLQIDYETGTYILSLPLVRFQTQVNETWRRSRLATDKSKVIRNKQETFQHDFSNAGYLNPMDTLMGRFSPGQEEIVIRRTASLEYTDFLWHDIQGRPVHISPSARGQVILELVLRRTGR